MSRTRHRARPDLCGAASSTCSTHVPEAADSTTRLGEEAIVAEFCILYEGRHQWNDVQTETRLKIILNSGPLSINKSSCSTGHRWCPSIFVDVVSSRWRADDCQWLRGSCVLVARGMCSDQHGRRKHARLRLALIKLTLYLLLRLHAHSLYPDRMPMLRRPPPVSLR